MASRTEPAAEAVAAPQLCLIASHVCFFKQHNMVCVYSHGLGREIRKDRSTCSCILNEIQYLTDFVLSFFFPTSSFINWKVRGRTNRPGILACKYK